ncbi:MAG: HD-GYP domain-containing protein [Acidimicrobiia bacterium]
MHERVPSESWVWLVSAGIPVLGVVAGVRVAISEFRLSHALIAAAAMVVLSFISVPTRSGVRMSPVVSAVASLPFIHTVGGTQLFDLRTGLAVVGMGTAVIWLVRTVRGDGPEAVLSDSARAIAVGVVYLVTFDRLGAGMLEPLAEQGIGWLADWWQLVAVAVVVPLAFAVEAVMASIPFRWDLVRSGVVDVRDFDVHLTLMATGALFGMTYDVIGWFALAIAGLPFLFAAGAFRRLAETRLAYAQTVRALAQVPEAAGHVHPGHADRVAALAGAVSRALGVRPGEVEELERAAYLHDIGRISLNDPGVVKIGYTEGDIAEWGAVIAEEAALPDVATVIRRQHEPYRRPGQLPDPDLPVGSRVIKVCSAYDELVSESDMSPLEALEQLHRGSVYDYDPDIVTSLRAILESTDSITQSIIGRVR